MSDLIKRAYSQCLIPGKYIFLLSLSILAAPVFPMHPFLMAAGQQQEAPKEHPYLLITPQRVQLLKDRIQQNRELEEAWQQMKNQADEIIDEDDRNREHLPMLGLAYQMTGEEDYAERARQIMLEQIDAKTWGSRSLLNRTPPWQSGLGIAHRTYDIAIGFDAVYNYLSEEDRQKIADGFVRLGIEPALEDWILGEERIHSFDSMGHNWWSSCVYMAGIGALSVLNEYSEAYDWVDQINKATEEWFAFSGNVLKNKTKSFDESGGFYEGPGYTDYAMRQYLNFRLLLPNVFPDRKPLEIDQLNKIGDFYLNTGYPDSSNHMSLNFGDSGIHTTGESTIQLLIANGYGKEKYWWHLADIRDEDEDPLWELDNPFELLYYPEDEIPGEIPREPGLPKDVLLKDMDWAIMRSSWDKDATMLGVKSGYTWNHTHADAGSFILFHNGENLIIDSGNSSYGHSLYDDYYRQSEAHNVVLFNGKAQDPDDTYYAVRNRGNLHHLLSSEDMKYVLADNTGPTGQYFYRNYRHFLWVGGVILVIDDLWSHEPGNFEWLLHYNGEAEHQGKDMRVSHNGAQVDVRPLFPAQLPDGGFLHDFPEKMHFTEKTGYKDHAADSAETYYAFYPPTQERRTKFVTALIPRHRGKAAPQIERLEGADYIGVRIKQDGEITDIYLNLLADGLIMHRNSSTEIKGWETDAYLTAFTYNEGDQLSNPGAIQRYFIANGSYLRRDGQMVLNSLSKVNMIADISGSNTSFKIDGQPVINTGFYSQTEPKNVNVNGRPIEAMYDKKTKLLQIRVEN